MTSRHLIHQAEPLVVESRPASVPTTQDERTKVATGWQRWLDRQWNRQCRDGSANHGAFDEHGNGWYDGRYNAFMVTRLVAVRCWSSLIQFDRQRLDRAILECLDFVLHRQTPEGHLDLGGAASPIEAGFAVPGLVEAWHRLADSPDHAAAQMRDGILQFVSRACEGLLTGDAMTANHRWAACCAALASAHCILPDARYLQRIDHYLADGIDCDEDGCWFHERSAGYNNVANHGMLVMARCLNRPDLLDHVIRNLNFTLYNIQPDGSFDSSYSFRQDRGCLTSQPSEYGIARRVAQLTGDGRFTTVAQMRFPQHGPAAGELMPLLFELDRHPDPLPAPRPLPCDYVRLFPSMQLARIRHHKTALTLSADKGDHFFDTVLDRWQGPRRSEDWFHLRHGELAIASIQIAVAGGRAVQPNRLERQSDQKWLLTADRPPWQHVQHFRPGMPRVTVDIPVHADLLVTCEDGRILLDVNLQTAHMLAASLKIWIGAGTTVASAPTQSLHLEPASHHALLTSDNLRLSRHDDTVTISGLPQPQHRMLVNSERPIPSGLSRECGCLSIGLSLPTRFTLCIVPNS